MRVALLALASLLFPGWVWASPGLSCALEHNGEEAVLRVLPAPDVLGGVWQEMDLFRVRLLLAVPEGRRPWLLVEVYAKAADDDFRIIAAQKTFAPFASGQVEVVEPGLGRSLRYECGEVK